jgi:CopG family nickel-responsive transcriptional regulator
MEKITRFGVSIEPDLLKKFDKIIKMEGYTNRSEAIRDLVRKNLIREENKNPKRETLQTSSLIYSMTIPKKYCQQHIYTSITITVLKSLS